MLLCCSLATSYAGGYLIKPGDSLGITVLGEADLTKHVVVDPQGNISMPLVKEISVVGLTPAEASQRITEQLKHFMKNPQVSIEFLDPVKIQVTVSGEVRTPGIYPVASSSHVMDAITAAGGYAAKADLSRVTVAHSNNAEASVTVDLNKFMLTGDTSANIALTSGDTVVVPSRESVAIGSVNVIGAVRLAGTYPITQGMTVREAVMQAGGPNEFADTKKIILRHEGSSEAISIDSVLANSGDPASNPALRPGDVVFVAPKQILGYFTIQGAVIKPGRYEIKEAVSVTDAIAIAGGTTERPKLNEVRILRPSAGGMQTVAANVSDILVGKSANIAISDGDTVYIPGKGEKTNYLQFLSVAVSLGWLLSGR